MKTVAITGAKGYIGKILVKNFSNKYTLRELDLPECDVRDYEQLLKSTKNCDCIIHLAWDTKTENFKSGEINPDNVLMTYNVYKVCLENEISRVIMASSVHADSPFELKENFLDPYRLPIPDSPYGASKCFMEALGRYYAYFHGLEVICLRIGGIGYKNCENARKIACYEKPYFVGEDAVWISERDFCDLIEKCIETELKEKFVIVYAVGNNRNRVHNLKNPFSWKPKEGCE